jgi:hypothetical protein
MRIVQKTKNIEDDLAIAPPVAESISAKYIIKLPVSDAHFKNLEAIKAYATKLLEKKLGDDVEINRLKIKKPGLASKLVSKVFDKTPNARLYITVDF